MSNLFTPVEPQVESGPARWLVLDTETQEGRPEAVYHWLRAHWWPQENLKPDTNLRKLEELITKKNDQLALLDAADPALVQLRTPSATLLLHALYAEPAREFQGVPLLGFATVPEMLVVLRDWLDEQCDEGTTLVGWNIEGFDLRRLRMWFLRSRLNLPKVLNVRQPVYDMMKEYCRRFSVDRVEFLKLAVALEQIGIPSRKAEVNGSMVGGMIREKRFEDLFAYGLSDVNEETELWLTMTGKSARLQ